MQSATFVRVKSLVAVAVAAALGACTDAGTREAALQDSAIQANEQPVPAAQPESVTTAPTPAPSTSTARPTTSPRPAQTEPPLRQPPPPRDTRPSIPYPPDTI